MVIWLLGIQGGLRGVPQIISCTVNFTGFFSNFTVRTEITDNNTAKLGENILHDHFLCFHISLHPIQGHKLPSYNLIFWRMPFVIHSFFFCLKKSNKLIISHKSLCILQPFFLQSLSRILTGFVRKEKRSLSRIPFRMSA